MSFIASLAAVGTAVGVTGAVAAPLAGAGVLAAGGAALGAGTSAAMGGDPGEGALMGAVTAPFMAPLMPAASAGTAIAENVGANVAGNVGANVAENVGANAATNVGTQVATEATKQAATQGIEQLAANPLVNATTTQIVPKTVALQPLTEVATPSWGQSLIGNAFNTPVTGTMAKIGGGALENAVYGAGANTGINALTGRPLDENLGTSTIAGGIGGGAANALGAGVGSSFLPTKVTEFAAKNPGITSAAIGLPASMMLSNLTASSPELPTAPENPWSKKFKYPNTFTYMAAGGITDIDGYASNAQNVNQAPNAFSQIDIPNQAEVANPEGYAGNSMRLMAQGGIASFGDGGGVLRKLTDPSIMSMGDAVVKNSLPGMIFDWKGVQDVPLLGGLYSQPTDTATLTPDEKKRLMGLLPQQGAPVQADNPQSMAQGGIADLGGYAAGGRPNLLHGPGDGVSDDIPASIAGKQPARLAQGEYVIPARIVSELGNGSTDAGAARLDAMVQKVNAGRAKTLGGKKYAKDTKAYRHLPV